jgi:GT2 family glycosyltransferase
MRISLVIPCYDAARTLGRVLQGVRAQSVAPDEVLVVDDGSSDSSGQVARAFGVQVVAHGENRGLAAARNTGLERARGELVVFVDSDAVPQRDLVRRLVTGFEDQRLAGLGGQVMEPGTAGLPDRWRAVFWRQTQGERALSEAPFLIGACCSLRRGAALSAGGFSADFRTNGEDVELSLRLQGRGFRLAYDPLARVTHLRHDSVGSLLSMVQRHSRDHVRALRTHGRTPWPVTRAALRWGPVTLVSSLRRHRSPGLAALSVLGYGASLYGCLRGYTWSMSTARV